VVFVDAARAEPDFPEWLYDVIWLEYDGDRIDRVALVAECEWGTEGDVVEDFQKVLVARATVRLLIYDAHRASDMTARLRQHIETFRESTPGDVYLVVAYDQNAADWWLTFTEIRVTDGRGTEVVRH